MKTEIIESIIDLKDSKEPQAVKVRERLEAALNKEILEYLKPIVVIGSRLGYGTVQKVIKDVGGVIHDLEAGSPNWTK